MRGPAYLSHLHLSITADRKNDMNNAKPRGRSGSNPGFEVEIKSGGRAHNEEVSRREPVQFSPARAVAIAQAQRRQAMAVMVSSLLLAALVGWMWLSNPINFRPADAAASVNGEYITDKEVARELDLTRAVYDLTKSKKELPGADSVVEDLIARKMQAQDARKAGAAVTPEELENELNGTLTRTGLTREQLEAALAKYNLTLGDFRGGLADTLLINKYIRTSVVQGATTPEEQQNRVNEWRTNLAQDANIDRLKPARSGPAPRVGSEAPDFALADLRGNVVKLSSLRGRPVMVNFWATWCPPCRAEIPEIVKMYEETYKGVNEGDGGDGANGGNYEILGVATQSDRETVGAFAGEFKMTFPVLPDLGNQITSMYHVLPIPTTFFIGTNGTIRHIQTGLVDRPMMERWLLNKQ